MFDRIRLLKIVESFLAVITVSFLIAFPAFSQTNSAVGESNVTIDLNTGSTSVFISEDGKEVMTPAGTVTSKKGFTVLIDGSMVAEDGTTITRDGSITTPNGVTILPNGEILRPNQNTTPRVQVKSKK